MIQFSNKETGAERVSRDLVGRCGSSAESVKYEDWTGMGRPSFQKLVHEANERERERDQ